MIIKITDFRGGTRSRVRVKTPRPPICEGFGACAAGGNRADAWKSWWRGKLLRLLHLHLFLFLIDQVELLGFINPLCYLHYPNPWDHPTIKIKNYFKGKTREAVLELSGLNLSIYPQTQFDLYISANLGLNSSNACPV